ncbi:hypothetical protein SGLAD_v1c06890 [Spiroplasma gladiatoris]|uniref:Transmembrane protein n=1 Tax=Spiroplasma gladiatoris TaxID=2143 RepID=A0A4P7AJB5_9MOLU|nr:hypothetical protein [Spiroplasma gladiatoris]QBQ07888.1 hypothetical protein SGLAD_v1c06890 [Spiroplasma gladiatoris]
MKKISNFIVKLKPYKRLYKIFWLSFSLLSLFLFQIIMLIFSIIVAHTESGFTYYFFGFTGMFAKSVSEPNSAHGFIFAAGVSLIPMIILIPILYFTFARWFIEEWLSDKFINVPKDKYLKWSKFFHYCILAAVFIIIPGLMSYMGGGGILPHQTFYAVPGTFSENYAQHVAGIFAFLYYGVGCFYTIIVVFWAIGMGIKWLYIQFIKWWNKVMAGMQEKKEQRRAEKISKMGEKKVKNK